MDVVCHDIIEDFFNVYAPKMNKDLDFSFNLILVATGRRPATFQSSGGRYGMPFPIDELIISLREVTGRNIKYYLKNKDIIIYDADNFSEAVVKKAFDEMDEYMVGVILGFECPGQQGITTQFLITMSVDTQQFYAEKCRDRDILDSASFLAKVASFQECADSLGWVFSLTVITQMSIDHFQSLFGSGHPDPDEIRQNAGDIYDYFWHAGFDKTAKIIRAEISSGNIDTLIDKFGDAWSVFAALTYDYLKNTDEESKEYLEQRNAMLEQEYYAMI